MANEGSTISPEKIAILEEEALEKVSKAISSIESVIAIWQNAKEKTPDINMRIEKLKKMHESFSMWAKKALVARAYADYKVRSDLLLEYVKMCNLYL